MKKQMEYTHRVYGQKCPVCGKEFAYCPNDHVYKTGGYRSKIYFCSWTCMLKYEKTIENKEKRV